MNVLYQRLEDHVDVVTKTIHEHEIEIFRLVADIVHALKNGNKVLFCGNGGSAADSQHLAAEFVGRFQAERQALPAIALTTDTSALTALGNDYGFNKVFARQVEAIGKTGDILIGISTSGNSENVVQAFQQAEEKGITIVSLTGKSGGKLKHYANINISSQSEITARIQEAHILVGHIVCELVEKEFIKE